jgi:hypothetical protein
MLVPLACVAIQIVGSPATPTEIEALQQRCGRVLGVDRCRVMMPDVNGVGRAADSSCWRATVAIADKGAAATVVLAAGNGPAARETRRDLTFGDRDEIPERWATLGLVIAALVTIEEHSAAAREPPSSMPPASAAERLPLPPPLAATTTTATADRGAANRDGWPTVHAGLVGVAAAGILPGAALGARVETLLTWTRLGVLARLAYYPSRNRATVPVANGNGGGQFRLWSAGLGLCMRARAARRLSLRGCGGADVASTAASGFGVADTSTASALSSTIWGGVAAEIFLSSRIAIIAEPNALFAVHRSTFAIRGAGTVYTPARFGGSIAVGLAVGF